MLKLRTWYRPPERDSRHDHANRGFTGSFNSPRSSRNYDSKSEKSNADAMKLNVVCWTRNGGRRTYESITANTYHPSAILRLITRTDAKPPLITSAAFGPAATGPSAPPRLLLVPFYALRTRGVPKPPRCVDNVWSLAPYSRAIRLPLTPTRTNVSSPCWVLPVSFVLRSCL